MTKKSELENKSLSLIYAKDHLIIIIIIIIIIIVIIIMLLCKQIMFLSLYVTNTM